MPVSHVRAAAVASTVEQAGDEIPGLLEVLAWVPDPRRNRGRRYRLVFMLTVAVACVLAGAKNFREIGDQARDLPQDVLRRLGGQPHPLLRKIITPSEKRIRTLIHDIDAGKLDELVGGWLRALADAGRLERLLTAIAIDGKWLRGVGDGQVKLFAAQLEVWQEGRCVTTHPRCFARGQEVLNLEHYLDVLEHKPGALAGSKPLDQWRRLGRWPQSYDTFWQALMQRQGTQAGTKAMIGLLQLGRTHGQAALTRVIEEALRLGVYDSAAVQHLLETPQLARTQAALLDVGVLG